jgi:hypothetical protein
MKNILGFCTIIGLTFLLQSCASTTAQTVKSGPQPLIQNSDFAIVTQRLDTLYLCSDESISFYLKECWDRGDFKPARKPVINIVSCDDFEKLIPRTTGGKISQLSN